jgi:hypothetical protein
MLADYLKAAIPRPVTLLGQRLRPFCRGHLLALLRQDCAFVKEGGTPEVGDLLLGVYVCCHKAEEIADALEALTPEMVMDWGARVAKLDFNEEAAAFLAYVREGCSMPELLDTPGDGAAEGVRTPGAPFLQKLGLFLQHKLHMSRLEALNMPLGEALHDWCAFYEWQGSLKIKGPDEDVTDPKTLAIEAEILRDMGWTEEQIAAHQGKGLRTEGGGLSGDQEVKEARDAV